MIWLTYNTVLLGTARYSPLTSCSNDTVVVWVWMSWRTVRWRWISDVELIVQHVSTITICQTTIVLLVNTNWPLVKRQWWVLFRQLCDLCRNRTSLYCAKLRWNFDVFGPPNFGEKEPPKFLTKFYKLWSQLYMWQSLVTIGRATSEIRRRKIEHLNYSVQQKYPLKLFAIL